MTTNFISADGASVIIDTRVDASDTAARPGDGVRVSVASDTHPALWADLSESPGTSRGPGEWICAFPDFDGEQWVDAIEPHLRRTAVRELVRYGLRAEPLEQTAEDICQAIAIKALTHPELCVLENVGLRVTAVRNAVIDWNRRRRGLAASDTSEEMEAQGLRAVRVTGAASSGGARPLALPATPSAEDLAFADESLGFSKLAVIERHFRAAARAEVARLIREDAAFGRRLRRSAVSRGMLFLLLRRRDLLATLLQGGGRDHDGAAEMENALVESRYGADVRTIRNRRSDWLRFLREFFAKDLAQYAATLRMLFPTLRRG